MKNCPQSGTAIVIISHHIYSVKLHSTANPIYPSIKLKSMITEYLQLEIVRLKSQIDAEETRYFDSIKDNQIVLELIQIRQNIKELRYELEQKIEMLNLL